MNNNNVCGDISFRIQNAEVDVAVMNGRDLAPLGSVDFTLHARELLFMISG